MGKYDKMTNEDFDLNPEKHEGGCKVITPTAGNWYIWSEELELNPETSTGPPLICAPGPDESIDICTVNADLDEYVLNARLILAACNACKAINPERPMEVAKRIESLFREVLDAIHCHKEGYGLESIAAMNNLEHIISEMTKVEPDDKCDDCCCLENPHRKGCIKREKRGDMGSLWWILKPEELVAFQKSIEKGRPIEITKIDYANHEDGQADVIFRLEKGKAREILGYEPDEGDWLEEDQQ